MEQVADEMQGSHQLFCVQCGFSAITVEHISTPRASIDQKKEISSVAGDETVGSLIRVREFSGRRQKIIISPGIIRIV